MDIEEDELVELGDLAGELDDEPDGLEDDEEGLDEPLPSFVGDARGGPLDGQRIASRYPKGVLLVDMERRVLWIYDRQDGGAFLVRSEEPQPINDENRWQAAEEPNYDILVPDAELAGEDDG